MEFFDTHFHIIDPRFPLFANNGFTPDYYTIGDWKEELTRLGLDPAGGAVASGSFQAYDQSYLITALEELGENYVGVTQLPGDVSEEEILSLTKKRIRTLRFNFFRGFSTTYEEFARQSRRVYELAGWKTEIYIDAAKIDDDFMAIIEKLPLVSIDHLGMRKAGRRRMLEAAAKGIPIRATGFGRIDYSREEISALLRELYDANPEGIMFGSDLPSTRAERRFDETDIRLMQEVFNESELRKVMLTNAQKWYLG